MFDDRRVTRDPSSADPVCSLGRNMPSAFGLGEPIQAPRGLAERTVFQSRDYPCAHVRVKPIGTAPMDDPDQTASANPGPGSGVILRINDINSLFQGDMESCNTQSNSGLSTLIFKIAAAVELSHAERSFELHGNCHLISTGIVCNLERVLNLEPDSKNLSLLAGANIPRGDRTIDRTLNSGNSGYLFSDNFHIIGFIEQDGFFIAIDACTPNYDYHYMTKDIADSLPINQRVQAEIFVATSMSSLINALERLYGGDWVKKEMDVRDIWEDRRDGKPPVYDSNLRRPNSDN